MTHVGAILAMALCVVVCGHLEEGGVWIKSNEEEKVFKSEEKSFCENNKLCENFGASLAES